MEDPRWEKQDDVTKQALTAAAFDRDIASDERWPTIDPETQQKVRSEYFQQAKDFEYNLTTPERRGFFGRAASAVGRGVVGAIGTAGQAMEMADLTPEEADTETGLFDTMGRKVSGWAQETIETTPFLRPDKGQVAGEPGFVQKGVLEGLESTPLSLSIWGFAGAGALAGSPLGPVGTIVGGAIGGLTGLVTMFGMGQYGKEYSSAQEELARTRPDLSKQQRQEIAHRVAFGSTLFEVGTELPENLLLLFTYGSSKALTQPLKATIKNLLKAPARTHLKKFALQASGQVVSEMVAGGGQAWVRTKEGLEGPTIGEGVTSSIIPAFTMSVIFGSGASGMSKIQSGNMMGRLNAADQDVRKVAALQMAHRIAGNTKDADLAKDWHRTALDTINNGQPFEFDQKLVDFAQVKMAEDVDAAETEKPEEASESIVKNIISTTTVDEAIHVFMREADETPSAEDSAFAFMNDEETQALTRETFASLGMPFPDLSNKDVSGMLEALDDERVEAARIRNRTDFGIDKMRQLQEAARITTGQVSRQGLPVTPAPEGGPGIGTSIPPRRPDVLPIADGTGLDWTRGILSTKQPIVEDVDAAAAAATSPENDLPEREGAGGGIVPTGPEPKGPKPEALKPITPIPESETYTGVAVIAKDGTIATAYFEEGGHRAALDKLTYDQQQTAKDGMLTSKGRVVERPVDKDGTEIDATELIGRKVSDYQEKVEKIKTPETYKNPAVKFTTGPHKGQVAEVVIKDGVHALKDIEDYSAEDAANAQIGMVTSTGRFLDGIGDKTAAGLIGKEVKPVESVKPVKIIKFNDLPDRAKGAIASDARVKKQLSAEFTESEWTLETVSIESLKDKNESIWSDKFTPRGSKTKEPLIVDNGVVLDGNNRLFEAIQRGENEIDILRRVSEKQPEVKVEKVEKVENAIIKRVDDAINQRERSNILVDEGQKAVPGIRLQDSEEAGQMAYLLAKGDVTQKQFDDWAERAKRENRVRPTEEAPKAEGKEPYEMSREEWKEEHAFEDINPHAHEYAVKQAIASGKITSHPDYPKLGKKVEKPVMEKTKEPVEAESEKPTIFDDRLEPVAEGDPNKITQDRIDKKYAAILSEPELEYEPIEGDFGSLIEKIEDETAAPEDIAKYLQKPLKDDIRKESIGKIKSAIAGSLGNLQETYRYESYEEGKDLEKYIDSLLEAVERHSIPSAIPGGTVLAEVPKAEVRALEEPAELPDDRRIIPPDKKVEKAEKPPIEITGKKDKTVSVDMPEAQAEALSPKEQKKYLMAEIDKAIETAKEGHPERFTRQSWEKNRPLDKSDIGEANRIRTENIENFGTITIEVPGDGEFTILNSKVALKEFKEKAKGFPVAVPKQKVPAIPTHKPITGRIAQEDVSYYNEFRPRKQGLIERSKNDPNGTFFDSGYMSEGGYIIKAPRSAIKGKVAEESPDMKAFAKDANKNLSPVNIAAETFEGLPGHFPTAHVVSEDGEFQTILNAKYVDSILTLHPEAKAFADTSKAPEEAPVVFKRGKEVVGIVMPLRLDADYIETLKAKYEKKFGPKDTKIDILSESKQPPAEKGPQYSTTPGEAGITAKDVQKLFKGQNVGLSPDGTIWVRTNGGNGLRIEIVKQIDEDNAAFEINYGRMRKEGELITGDFAYHKELNKDTYTVTHIPSNMRTLDGLTAKEARELAYRYSQSGLKWNGEGTPPKEFVEGMAKLSKDFRSRETIKGSLSALIDTIKNEKGSISLESPIGQDLVQISRDIYLQGNTRFGDFRAELRRMFSEVWEKIKHLIRKLYRAAKQPLMNERGMIGGPRARTADKGALAKASEMEAAGTDMETIRKETGWFLGLESIAESNMVGLWPKIFKGSSMSEGAINGMSVYPKLLSDLLVSKSFHSKGHNGLDVPTNRMVFAAVISMLHNPKIRNAVIGRVPVNMMNKLTGEKFSTKNLLHDMPMLSDLLAVDADNSIALSVDSADKITIEVARATTKHFGSKPHTWFEFKFSPTVVTDEKGRFFVLPRTGMTAKKQTGFVPFDRAGRTMDLGATYMALDSRHEDTSKNIFDSGILAQNIKTVKEKPLRNLWKFEIDDSKAALKTENLKFAPDRMIDGESIGDGFYTGEGKTLSDVLEHPELFKAYPQLKDIKIFLEYGPRTKGQLHGQFTKTSIIVTAPTINEAKSTLLHEIQHAVQEIEGFGRGGSPTPEFYFSDLTKKLKLKELKTDGLKEANRRINNAENQAEYEAMKGEYRILEKTIKELERDPGVLEPYEIYRRLAGEIESREVSMRMNLTPEQRKLIPLYLDGIPKEDVIVRFGSGPQYQTQAAQNRIENSPGSLSDKMGRKADIDAFKDFDDDISWDKKGHDWSTKGFKDFSAKMYAKFVMSEYPVIRLAKKTGPKITGQIENQIRRIRGKGGIVEAILTSPKALESLKENDITEYGGIDISLKEILGNLGNNKIVYQDYERYRVAQRDLSFAEYRPDIKGVDAAKASKVLSLLKDKYGENLTFLESVSKRHREFERKAVLEPLVKSGWMSKEQYEAIINRPESEYYASFLREMEDVEREVVGGGKDPVKRIYGSEKKKIPSVEGTIANVQRTVKLIETLRLNKQVVSLKDLSADLAEIIKERNPVYRIVQGDYGVYNKKSGKKVKFATRVFDTEREAQQFVGSRDDLIIVKRPDQSVRLPMQPKGTVTVSENGNKKYFTVPEDVRQALDYYSPQEISTVVKVLSYPARLLRAGATLSAEFISRNPVRDQFSAYIYSKYGYNPFKDFAKGMFHQLKKDALYNEYKAAGGEQTYFASLDRQSANVTAANLVGYEGGKLKAILKNPIEALRMFSEWTEKGTRLGLYESARRSGATPLEAMTEAREGTLDFGRIGSEKSFNQIIAFWNANVQGTDKLVRSLRERPGQTILKAFMGITLPSIALWFINKDDDRYKALPEWQKNFFWVIPIGKDGPIIRIPKPFEIGLIFGSLPERILDYIYYNDPDAIKQIGVSALEGLSPGLIPTGALPVIEHITNYSFFRGQRLESEGLERLPPAMRYRPYTTEAAKKLGALINVSPVKIENWVNGWSGTLGRESMRYLNPLLRDQNIPEVSRSWYETTPAIKGFIAREPLGSGSKYTDKFYNNMEDILQADAGFKVLRNQDREEAGKYRREHIVEIGFAKLARKYATRLSDIRKAIGFVINNKSMAPERKKEKIDEMNGRISDLAKQFNDRYAKFKTNMRYKNAG